MSPRALNIAVAGATGAVGNQMIACLEERNFPVESIKLLASSRSAGKTLKYRNQDVTVEELTSESFKGVDIALFSAGVNWLMKLTVCAHICIPSWKLMLVKTSGAKMNWRFSNRNVTIFVSLCSRSTRNRAGRKSASIIFIRRRSISCLKKRPVLLPPGRLL